MQGTTTIEISITDLRALRDMPISWQDVVILANAGVFSFKNGIAELHRDGEGRLREVKVAERRYKV